jgi:hypothetical protein
MPKQSIFARVRPRQNHVFVGLKDKLCEYLIICGQQENSLIVNNQLKSFPELISG